MLLAANRRVFRVPENPLKNNDTDDAWVPHPGVAGCPGTENWYSLLSGETRPLEFIGPWNGAGNHRETNGFS